jgi:hypothetical protein
VDFYSLGGLVFPFEFMKLTRLQNNFFLSHMCIDDSSLIFDLWPQILHTHACILYKTHNFKSDWGLGLVSTLLHMVLKFDGEFR